MASLLESLSEMINPDAIGSLSKSLGADSSAITKALGAAGPLLLGGMANLAGTPAGAQSLFDMAKNQGSGILGNLGSVLGGLFGGGGAAPGSGGLMSMLLGSGANGIAATLSKTFGFNVGPILGFIAPAMVGLVSKAASSQNLDASGLASMLKKENDAFVANPANKATMEVVNAARAAGDKATSLVQSYGADWAKVAAGPAAALFMVASADPSGPIDTVKEARAAGDKLVEIAKGAAPTSLIGAAFGSGMTVDMLQQVRSVAPSKDKLLDAIKAAVAAVAAKSPSEAQSYKNAIISVAEATATASKDGGFLGIGGKLVSDDEQAALNALKAALA
jgi:hypothetical protein